MSRQRALQPAAADAEQSHRHRHVVQARCYTAAQIVAFLQISSRTFFELKRRGRLPFLEELRPRLGRTVRYRADLVDRYLAGQWGTSRFFASHDRQSRKVSGSTVSPFSGHTQTPANREKEVR